MILRVFLLGVLSFCLVGSGGVLAQDQDDTPPEDMPPTQKAEQVKAAPIILIYPKYPIQAARDGIEGFCTLSFTVDKKGQVSYSSMKIIDEKPKGVFCRASERSALKMRYKPFIENGRIIAKKAVTYRFDFKLSN